MSKPAKRKTSPPPKPKYSKLGRSIIEGMRQALAHHRGDIALPTKTYIVTTEDALILLHRPKPATPR